MEMSRGKVRPGFFRRFTNDKGRTPVYSSLLLFDFDGTLYRGDAPFYFYAKEIARTLPGARADEYLRRVDRHLQAVEPLEAFDHWEAVIALAQIYGADPAVFDNAFTKTRIYMNAGGCALEVPQALRTFLIAVKGKTTLAVASNSPWHAARPLMDRLELTNLFDCIVTDAHKPEGLIDAARQCANGQVPDTRIASVGDHYRNDIAPAHKAGWRTAHIHPQGVFPGPSTAQGRRIEEVLPLLEEWLQEWGWG